MRFAKFAGLTAATALLLAGVMLFEGCGKKAPPKAAPPPPPPPVAGPPGVLAFASQGRILRMRKGESPEVVAGGPAWFPALNADGSLLAYWEDRGATMRLVALNTVSRSTAVVGEWA